VWRSNGENTSRTISRSPALEQSFSDPITITSLHRSTRPMRAGNPFSHLHTLTRVPLSISAFLSPLFHLSGWCTWQLSQYRFASANSCLVRDSNCTSIILLSCHSQSPISSSLVSLWSTCLYHISLATSFNQSSVTFNPTLHSKSTCSPTTLTTLHQRRLWL
jgi:hypothetical protein